MFGFLKKSEEVPNRNAIRAAMVISMLALCAPASHAATITESAFMKGDTPNAADFKGFGSAGSGRSVLGDGKGPVLLKKSAFGRNAGEVDSQDLGKVVWTVTDDKAFSKLSFTLSDILDVPPAPAKTFFQIEADGATWRSETHKANGSFDTFLIILKEVTKSLAITFTTPRNNGFGVGNVCRRA